MSENWSPDFLFNKEIILPDQFAFVHIPRVGGTTVRLKLLEHFGNNGLHWSDDHGLEPFNSSNHFLKLRSKPYAYELKRLLMNIELGPINGQKIYRTIRETILGNQPVRKIDDSTVSYNNARFIIGHFDALTIRSLFPKIPLVSLIRNPFDRFVSEFIYQGRTREDDFVSYMHKTNQINYLTKVLGLYDGITLDDYVAIGITDKIDDFFRRIGLESFAQEKATKHNQLTNHDSLRSNLQKYKAMFDAINHQDIELYTVISKQWE